jgi:hypothetical protein
VAGASRKLHSEEFQNLYAVPDNIKVINSRKMIWAGHVARLGEMRNAYKVLVGKPERKRPLGRPRRARKNNIRMDLWEMVWDVEDWILLMHDLFQRRALVNTVTKGGRFLD